MDETPFQAEAEGRRQKATRLEGACQQVAVVGQARGEGRPIIEDILGQALGAAQLLLEGVEVVPEAQNGLFFGGEMVFLPLLNCLHRGGARQDLSVQEVNNTKALPKGDGGSVFWSAGEWRQDVLLGLLVGGGCPCSQSN
jgi:hypothetical protein